MFCRCSDLHFGADGVQIGGPIDRPTLPIDQHVWLNSSWHLCAVSKNYFINQLISPAVLISHHITQSQ